MTTLLAILLFLSLVVLGAVTSYFLHRIGMLFEATLQATYEAAQASIKAMERVANPPQVLPPLDGSLPDATVSRSSATIDGREVPIPEVYRDDPWGQPNPYDPTELTVPDTPIMRAGRPRVAGLAPGQGIPGIGAPDMSAENWDPEEDL